MWRDLRDLLEMYWAGGLVIMTGMDGAEMETAVPLPSAADITKTYSHTGIRTTIQFDSDYITVITPAVLQQPQIWQQHIELVHAKLAVLDKLRTWAQKSWMLFLLIPIAWFGMDFANVNSPDEAWQLIYPMLLSAVIVWGRKWLLRILQKTILPLIMKAVSWFVQRKFRQFVGAHHKQDAP
ncbi:MAG: hypothetical protein IAF02_07320 [Anaerolineae bacterium]|nr:hypothetical protein [Anaerolineae bacterium]